MVYFPFFGYRDIDDGYLFGDWDVPRNKEMVTDNQEGREMETE